MAGLVDLKRIDVSTPEVLLVVTGRGMATFGLANVPQQLVKWRQVCEGQRHGKRQHGVARSFRGQQFSGALARSQDHSAAGQTAQNHRSKRNAMFDSSSIIVGLEIGTSKVCAVVGEMNDEGALNIVGLGQQRSRGVRKGEIVDARTVEGRRAPRHRPAEQMADAEIRSVYLGVSGGHSRLQQSLACIRWFPPIAKFPEDVLDVVKNAKAINLPQDNTVLHAIRQHFLWTVTKA